MTRVSLGDHVTFGNSHVHIVSMLEPNDWEATRFVCGSQCGERFLRVQPLDTERRRCLGCFPHLRPAPPPTSPTALDADTTRELSRAAKNVATWTEKRNELIRQALASGGGVREVARATGLAPATVLNIQTPKKRGGTRAEPEP